MKMTFAVATVRWGRELDTELHKHRFDSHKDAVEWAQKIAGDDFFEVVILQVYTFNPESDI